MARIWRKPLGLVKTEMVQGKVYIIKDRCKGCGFCIEFCPREVLEFSDEFNVKGYHPPRAVQPERCLDCDLCEIVCPEFSIFTELDVEAEREGEGGSNSHACGC